MGSLKDPASHDDLLNYQLKRLLALGGAPAIRLCEGGYGIARFEWRLTAALVENGPMSVGELAARTHTEPARVSRSVKVLVDKGFVQRTPARRGQAVLLSMTEQGGALYRDLLPRLAAINRNLMAVLSEQEARLLQDFLARLTAQAKAIHAGGGGVALKTGRYLGALQRSAPLAPARVQRTPRANPLPWGKAPAPD